MIFALFRAPRLDIVKSRRTVLTVCRHGGRVHEKDPPVAPRASGQWPCFRPRTPVWHRAAMESRLDVPPARVKPVHPAPGPARRLIQQRFCHLISSSCRFRMEKRQGAAVFPTRFRRPRQRARHRCAAARPSP